MSTHTKLEKIFVETNKYRYKYKIKTKRIILTAKTETCNIQQAD